MTGALRYRWQYKPETGEWSATTRYRGFRVECWITPGKDGDCEHDDVPDERPHVVVSALVFSGGNQVAQDGCGCNEAAGREVFAPTPDIETSLDTMLIPQAIRDATHELRGN